MFSLKPTGFCKNEDCPSSNELLEFLQAGSFAGCGASVGKNPSKAICQAALNAITKRLEDVTQHSAVDETTQALNDLSAQLETISAQLSAVDEPDSVLKN